MNYDVVTAKKKKLDSYRPIPKELVKNLDDWFRVEFTYSSNAIEGNTLTRSETAIVVEKGITIGGKRFVEHLEAINHSNAVNLIIDYTKGCPTELSEFDIKIMHQIILSGIDNENAGCYRKVNVKILGSSVKFPEPMQVPDKMLDFVSWLNKSTDLHPVEFAAEAHLRLVSIHPFIDGNGRTSRLLMNLILIMFGYPIAVIQSEDRKAYIDSLEKIHTGGSKEDFYQIVCDATERSLDIYLEAAAGSIESS